MDPQVDVCITYSPEEYEYVEVSKRSDPQSVPDCVVLEHAGRFLMKVFDAYRIDCRDLITVVKYAAQAESPVKQHAERVLSKLDKLGLMNESYY